MRIDPTPAPPRTVAELHAAPATHPVGPAAGIPPARRPRFGAPRFARISDQPSTALRVATGYFRLSGGLTLLFGTIALVVGAVHGTATAAPLAYAFGAATVAGTGLGALWTAGLLQRKRRLGGVVAIATLLAPVVQWALGGGPSAGVLFALVGAAIMASVWNELE